MRRPALRGIIFSLLALWAQLVAPATALSMHDAIDPLAVICSHSADGKTRPNDGHGTHRHEHCLVCQANLASAPPAGRLPALTSPVATLCKQPWRPNLARAPPGQLRQSAQPRGPPSSI